MSVLSLATSDVGESIDLDNATTTTTVPTYVASNAPQHSAPDVYLPIKGDEFRFGNIVFTSKFDSGNLQRVEKVVKDQVASDKPGYLDPVSDIEFNVWTRPDCEGTPYENGNRSWFYFGVRGYTPGKLLRINIMNMNKQGKLYSQGHTPIFRILPQRPQWERLKERCSFECVGNEFVLSFNYRLPELRGTIYFSFCYPWSYTESQQQMAALDKQFDNSDENITNRSESEIYYHRELFSHSLDGLRIDLLTISSYHGIKKKREPLYDPQLFPDRSTLRCRKFTGKKVFVLTSRVHPGESPASSVYNGFLNFILQSDDKRAIQLRKQYVFKLIPMLNPDGVVRGHYRTDSRGINLNRLYLDPVFELYPSIYAAKSLLVFHHVNNCPTRKNYIPNMAVIFKELSYLRKSKTSLSDHSSESPSSVVVDKNVAEDPYSRNHSAGLSSVNTFGGVSPVINEPAVMSVSEPMMRRCASADSSISFAHASIISEAQRNGTEHLNHPRLRLIPAEESGIAFYVDLHGHASKRGCFMYGNHFVDEDKAIHNLLFPKLISMNSAHFDYGGCNFTEKNMYTKDKKDGHSKEGSGRVAIYKSIGITHSYTLECNYSSGRLVNSLASSPDPRVTPPPVAGFPPKFTQLHFEEVGRAMAIAAIDYTDTNPLSRLQYSELNSVYAVKDWIRRTLRGGKGVSKFNRPSISINPKTMIRSTVQFYSVRSEPTIKARQPNQAGNLSDPQNSRTGFSFGRTPRFNVNNLPVSSTQSQAAALTNSAPGDLVHVKEAHRRSFSLPSPTVLLKCASNKPAANSLTEINQTRSYSLRLMHTMARHTNSNVQALQGKIVISKLQKQNSKENHQKSEEAGEAHPSPLVKLGALSVLEPVESSVAGLPPHSKKKGVHSDESLKKVPKQLSNASLTAVDHAKELGAALDKTALKFGKRKSSGRKIKNKNSGANGKGSSVDRVITRNGYGHLKGSNIKLTERSRDSVQKGDADGATKQSEMDSFEKELKNRMSSFKHSESYWVEL